MTENIVDRTVLIVNEAIELDPSAMKALFENRIPCNNRLAQHPTIQVLQVEDIGHTVGVLGLLSGIVGTRMYKGHPNFSKIWAVYDVDCPIHGVCDQDDLKVGDTCPEKDCDEKLLIGDLIRIERVPNENVTTEIIKILEHFLLKNDTGCDCGKCEWCKGRKIVESFNASSSAG